MNCHYLYCIIGPSGVGKTTLADGLCRDLHIKQVNSYTTRAPRTADEKGHIFVTPEQFKKLGHLCAYTKRNGIEYGVTAKLLNQSQIYVIDLPGIASLRKNYSRLLKIIGLSADDTSLVDRMIARGDKPDEAEHRRQLDDVVLNDNVLADAADIVIPTENKTKQQVLGEVKAYIVGTELQHWFEI